MNNNATEFQNQLSDLIYEINILTHAVEFFRNKFIHPCDEVDIKDLTVLINIINSFSSKVKTDATAVNEAQVTYFSNLDNILKNNNPPV